MEAFIHLDFAAEPVSGWLTPATGATPVPFIGYTELLAAIERLRRAAAPGATRAEGSERA